MWWKFLIGLAFGLFCVSLALMTIRLTVHQQRQAFLSVTQDLAPQKFLDLSTKKLTGEPSQPQPRLTVPTGGIE
jgi:hypothetical protein